MPLLTVAKQLAVLSQEVVLDVHMKACLVEASSLSNVKRMQGGSHGTLHCEGSQHHCLS